MKVTVNISGGQELSRRLRSLAPAAQSRLQRGALTRAAEPIRVRMGALAPRGDPKAPNLADSMQTQRTRSDDPREVAVVTGPTRDAFYGLFLEFGTVHMSARPFARPAFDTESQRALQILQNELWSAVRDLGAISTGSRLL